MAKRYYLRDTDLANGIYTVTYEKEMNTTVQSGSGTARVSDVVGNGSSAILYVFSSPANEPNYSGDWPDSDGTNYLGSLDISAADANMQYGPGIASSRTGRANSALTSYAFSETTWSTSWTGSGIKTHTQSTQPGLVGTGAASDRLTLSIGGQNNNTMHSNETITLDVDSADSWLEGPWTVPYQPRHGFVNYQNRGCSDMSRLYSRRRDVGI